MIHRSRHGDVSIPEQSLVDFLLESAGAHGDRLAFVDGPSGRSLSFRQWAAAVRRAASGLARRGFAKGDVLAIYSPNLPEYAVAFHGAGLLGGIITTMNPLYTPEEVRRQLDDSGAKLLVTVAPFLDKAKQAVTGTAVKEIFVFGEAEGATPFAALLEQDAEPPRVAIDPRQDLIALPYSSGTTGMPKGVMLTHHNLVANIVQSLRCLRVTEEDVLLGVLPFFHIYGLVCIMNSALRTGAQVVTMPKFELEGCLETMQQRRVSFAHVVPPIVLALAKHPVVEKYDLSALRMICSGAAPLSGSLARECAARLGCAVVQGYGMTELSPVTHVGDPEGGDPGSVGPAIPNTECKVVDLASGRDLGKGQEGEICVRGPQVMKGYLNNPEATAAMIDAGGWVHTGDVGYADDDGAFHIVDRVKELIKYKGLQIAPAELEAVLLAHPAVADAAVVGTPDAEAGEVPKAFLVLRGEATPEEIMAFVAERVAPYKKLRHVEVIDQVPKSPSGKILRRTLVAREAARA